MNDDDQLWLDALAGRRGTGATPAEREAIAFRRAMQARAQADDPGVPAMPAARRADALVERARRSGLFAATRGPRWLQGGRGIAVAALVGALAIGIGVLNRPAPMDETVRSAPTGAVVLRAEDPALHAHEIVDALVAAGVDALAYERLGRWGIDAELPQPLPPAVMDVLARYGVPPPADGVLTIEITEPAP